METATTGIVTPGKGKRFQVLIGAILVQLILGTVYGYSIFWEPPQNYLQSFGIS